MSERPGLYAKETDTFRFADLIFSRTDKRGVIKSANDGFVRVAGYPFEELEGAPHKKVRHPDMPRGVFHLMWAELEAGKHVGCYVCNLTEDGKPYWVYAVIMQLEDGYTSVRLKPGSDILDKVKPIYEQARIAEDEGTLTPEESADAIVKELTKLGYIDYRDFMSQALYAEMMGRTDRLGRSKLKKLELLSEISEKVKDVERYGSDVATLFSRTEQIPYNMRLQAGRLEGSDGPISVISENHRQMSQNLNASVGDFRSAAALGTGPVQDAVFVFAVATMMAELSELENANSADANERIKTDLQMLDELKERYSSLMTSEVNEIAMRVRNFSQVCKDMRRMLSGLEMTRIMCKIERAKTDGDTEGLDEIVNRLLVSEKELTSVMTQIDNAIVEILSAAEALLRKDTARDRQRLSA